MIGLTNLEGETHMVPGDALIILPLLASGLTLFGVSSTRGCRAAAAGLIALALLHGLSVGFRWQMFPAYALVALMASSLAARRRPRLKSLSGILSGIVLLGSIAASVLLSTLFPLFELPEPTGSYNIGTMFLEFVDPGRTEPLTAASGDHRTIYAQAWYPSAPGDSDVRAPYWRDAWKASSIAASSQGLGFLPFLWSHLGLIRTHAYQDAPISAEEISYPVVVFSHGYGQIASFNTALMEEIASHGYVVFNLSHPYETPFVVNERLQVIRTTPDRDALVALQERSPGEGSGSALGQLRDTSRLMDMDDMLQHLYRDATFLVDRTDCWAEDMLFVIDRIPELSDERFQGRLDAKRVAVMGWSFGGGAAGVATLVDSRIMAGMNLDAWQYGHLLGRNLRSPFLFLMSEAHGDANQFFLDKAEADVYRLSLRGASHSNFTDLALSAELPGKLTGRLGSIDGARGGVIVRRYVVEFLGRYVRDSDSDFLDGSSSEFPEIEFEAIPVSP
jgi:dienelactone hydrolase